MEAVNRNPQRQTDNMGTALDNSPQQNVASVALASTEKELRKLNGSREGPGEKPALQSILESRG